MRRPRAKFLRILLLIFVLGSAEYGAILYDQLIDKLNQPPRIGYVLRYNNHMLPAQVSNTKPAPITSTTTGIRSITGAPGLVLNNNPFNDPSLPAEPRPPAK